MFGHSIWRFRGLSALPQQCAKPHRSEALWLRAVAAAIGKQRHQPGTSGTVLKVVAPSVHNGAPRVEVVASLIGAGNLRTGDMRKTCFGYFKRYVLISHPASRDRPESMGYETACKRCAVQILRKRLSRDV